MLIILFVGVIGLLWFFSWRKIKHSSDGLFTFTITYWVVFSLAFLIGISLHFSTKSEVAGFREVKNIVKEKYNPRMTELMLERNEWLAKMKYFKGNVFVSWFVPNEIKGLTNIEIGKIDN